MTYMDEWNGGDVKIEMEQQTLRLMDWETWTIRLREAASGNL
jgi:hypothetical protein